MRFRRDMTNGVQVVTVPCYHVDAFADRPFTGNPAAVCLLAQWPPDAALAAVAAEFNLSETAFVKRERDAWAIRWFTPACEVELCGHATLAAAHVLINERGEAGRRVDFTAGMRVLAVAVDQAGRLELDFPADPPRPMQPGPRISAALGMKPQEVLLAADLLCVFPDADAVRAVIPDLSLLRTLPGRGVIVTAPGKDCDFVSRFFAPKVGVPEDPVTGSAHTALVPYWARRLGKPQLTARQLSQRGGRLWLEDRGERVGIAGHAVTVSSGTLRVMGYHAAMHGDRHPNV